MIHQYKTNICSRPIPAVEFDNFLKARYEKQSIIQVFILFIIFLQSQSQPIQSKVQSFYQLLKLTKSGSNFTKQSIKKQQQGTLIKTNTQSVKTINTLSQNNNNQYEFNNRFEDIESEEAQMKKLNRMVYGLSQWEEDKARISMYLEKRQKQEGKKVGMAGKKLVGNEEGRVKQSDLQRVKSRNQMAYSSCDGKRFRGYYAPLKKHQAVSQLSKITSQFTKTAPRINYPQSFLNCNFFTSTPNHFSQLKSKIKLLQNKAKNQYGLEFDRRKGPSQLALLDQKPHIVRSSVIFDDFSEGGRENAEEEMMFCDLQLGPMLANKESRQKYLFKTIKYGHKQNHLQDDSIPKGLIDGVIKNKTDSLHRIMAKNNKRILGSALGNNRDKLKKGYLSRPKTFKPSYMYVQI